MKSSSLKFNWLPLPPLSLRGVGTSRVESLEHYVLRQACTVGLTMANMMSLVGPLRNGSRVCQVLGSGKYCGPGRDFSHRIAVLKNLTGQDDLQCGSFWVLEDVLSIQGSRDSTRRRWCPVCYRDWDEDLSYEPLSWIVDVQVTCDLHHCRLESVCRACGADQPSTTEYQRRKICRKCRKPLAGDGKLDGITRDEAWAQDQLASIIELCATPAQQQIPFANYVAFVNELVAAHPGKRTYPNALKAEIYRVRKNLMRGRTTIRSIVNLCALQAISASELLLSPKAAASVPLLDLWLSYSTLNLPAGKHAERLAHCAQCLEDILEASQEGHYLPQMKLPLRRFRLNRRLLREMHLDVYEAYHARHEQQGPYSQRVHANRAMEFAVRMLAEEGGLGTSAEATRLAVDRIALACSVSHGLAASVLLGAVDFVKSAEANRLRKRPSIRT